MSSIERSEKTLKDLIDCAAGLTDKNYRVNLTKEVWEREAQCISKCYYEFNLFNNMHCDLVVAESLGLKVTKSGIIFSCGCLKVWALVYYYLFWNREELGL